MKQATITPAELRRTLRESPLERMFAAQVEAAGLPAPEREYRFAPPRRWRFDFAWPDLLIAVECEGGIHSHGRHVRASGFTADCEKYNAATLAGWRVLRYTASQIEDGTAIEAVRRMGCESGDTSPDVGLCEQRMITQRDERIRELEAEVERLEAGDPQTHMHIGDALDYWAKEQWHYIVCDADGWRTTEYIGKTAAEALSKTRKAKKL